MLSSDSVNALSLAARREAPSVYWPSVYIYRYLPAFSYRSYGISLLQWKTKIRLLGSVQFHERKGGKEEAVSPRTDSPMSEKTMLTGSRKKRNYAPLPSFPANKIPASHPVRILALQREEEGGRERRGSQSECKQESLSFLFESLKEHSLCIVVYSAEEK